jgi:cell division septal protein FtsQ
VLKPWQKRRRPRRRNPRRFSERPISYLLEALVCFALLGAFAENTYQYTRDGDTFRVKTIGVEGADVLKENDIIACSGVTNGDNVLFLDPEAARDRILAMPFVKTCRVKRFFPDRVIFAIKERSASATLLVDNRMFEVDEECHVLCELPPDILHAGPFITNLTEPGYVEPGKRLNHRALAGALAVWKAFRRTSMANEVTVSEISAAHERRICMYCDELGCEIRWGRGDYDKQAAKLDIFWRSQRGHIPCKEYVDLRYGNDVACK